MAYYYPIRDYHQLNSVAYPDHSRPIAGMDGILRAFWERGEQMWDQDFRNNIEWVARFWLNSYAYTRWQKPKYPWYNPVLSIYIVETDHNVDPDPEHDHAVFWQFLVFPFSKIPLKPWPGVLTTVLADRHLIGYRENPDGSGGGWQGLAQFQEYTDEIEIAFFASETRPNRIVGMHHVVEPFRLNKGTYSSRVRGWPIGGFGSPSLILLKNNDVIGTAWKSEYSSGISITEDSVEFAPGDTLAVKAPAGTGVRYGVTVSIIGELL